jgi:hypothetical protein
LVPATVRVKLPPPTTALLGESPAIVGAGFRTEKLAAAEVPPPGAGVKTVMAAGPAVASSLVGIAAVSRLALTSVVARSLPFQRTTEDARKLAPLTVSVKFGAPTVAVLGEMVVTVGAGFRIAKLAAVEVPPPGAGVTTVTTLEPAAARSLAGIVAVRLVELPNVVVRFAPFHWTTEDETKLAPVTVSVKLAPPTVAVAGPTLVTVGAGF